MSERTRQRKREREFKDTAKLMEAGGEGFIYDPIFKIKLGTYPILKDFKVRSYLNFMASLPMKRNPVTGYFEFAETAEEITALCRGYFWPAEPAALADAGYEKLRINKQRHLITQPTALTAATYKDLIITPDQKLWISARDTAVAPIGNVWTTQAVVNGSVSPSEDMRTYPTIGVYIETDAAVDIMVQVSYNNVYWIDHTTISFAAAGTKAQDIMGSAPYVRFKALGAATVTAGMMAKGA